jgi:Domain of unknown function DUF29
MAKALERPQALYDEDLLAWAERLAAHLRAGQLDRLDVEHLIEELEAMAGKLRRELKNRLRILLEDLLKWEALSPAAGQRPWPSSATRSRLFWRRTRASGSIWMKRLGVHIRALSDWRRSRPGCHAMPFRPSCPTTKEILGDDLGRATD